MKRAFLLLMLLPLLLSAQIDMVPGEDGILFTENGKEVIFYQVEPKAKEGKFSRCNYFHPVWGLDGQIITEDFPDDHLHHRGVFWAWHQLLVNGSSLGDLWELKGITQEVAEIEFIAQPSGAGVFKTEVYWKSEAGIRHGITGPVIKETTKVTIHPQKGSNRRIDFEIGLLALTRNVSLGGSDDEKGYGGFSVRMKIPDGVTFTGPDGRVEPLVTQVVSPGWVNITGSSSTPGNSYGIVITDHPLNPGFPQPWILRKERSMQNVAYPGRTPVELSQDTPLSLRYSLIVHNGNLKTNAIKRLVKK
jgi:hypothetical protein